MGILKLMVMFIHYVDMNIKVAHIQFIYLIICFFEECEDLNNEICREVVDWGMAKIIGKGSMDD